VISILGWFSPFEYAYILLIFSGFLVKFSRPAHFHSDLLAWIIDHVGQPFAIQVQVSN
jgi:hypothetical protein